MRTFNFKARNIGQEKYLTYTMGEDCDLDEDVLDYCEENMPEEILPIIYEEDDDYDYLTYDITEKTSLEDYIKDVMDCQSVLFILRNVANGLISLKEQAIPLSYVLLNRSFMYINDEDKTLKFICLPIESKGSLAVEFKGFVRQLLASMKYDVDEDLSYVGKLLTYINGDSFNLRGLIGLSEALLEEGGFSFEAAGTIDADGVEVVSAEAETEEKESDVASFMNDLADSEDAPLPELGDDEEDTEEETIEDNAEDMADENEEAEETEIKDSDEKDSNDDSSDDAAETAETSTQESKADEETSVEIEKEEKLTLKPRKKETDINIIKDRIIDLVGEAPTAKSVASSNQNIKSIDDIDSYMENRPPVIKKNVVKVNRAAIIQQTEAEMEAAEAEEKAATGETENIKLPVIEDIYDDMNIEKNEENKEEKKEEEDKPKSTSVLSKTVAGIARTVTQTNVPKALPYLVRVSTEERVMLSKTVFKIGKATRGVDYTIGGNGAISRQHAIITQKDGVCYIKDNKSTNHTFVNGKIVPEGTEEILTHDSMIRLADEEFLFKIR